MIFVVGAARSGTTLATRLIEECGARLGPVSSLAEHRPFKQDWVYPQLRQRGYDRYGQHPIPSEALRDVDPTELRRELEPMFQKVDCIKDVKMVHFWPAFMEAFPKALWLIVWRDAEKVAKSCARSGFMRAFGADTAAWKEWAEVYHERCRELKDHAPDRVFEAEINDLVRPDADGYNEFYGLIEAAGLECESGTVSQVFDASRWSG